MRCAIACASAASTAPATLISASSVAPSPSATIWRGEVAADVRERRRERGVGRGVRSTGAAPFASSTTASFVEHSPSTEIALKLVVDGGAQELDRLARLERVVGRDDREHRREVRVDHPGALRHAADGEAVAVRDRRLRLRVGGEDRLGRVVAAVGGERGGCGVEAGERCAPSAAARRSRRSRARAPAPARGRAARPRARRSRARRARPARRSRRSRRPS